MRRACRHTPGTCSKSFSAQTFPQLRRPGRMLTRMTTRMMQMQKQLRKRLVQALKMQPGGELLQA